MVAVVCAEHAVCTVTAEWTNGRDTDEYYWTGFRDFVNGSYTMPSKRASTGGDYYQCTFAVNVMGAS